MLSWIAAYIQIESLPKIQNDSLESGDAESVHTHTYFEGTARRRFSGRRHCGERRAKYGPDERGSCVYKRQKKLGFCPMTKLSDCSLRHDGPTFSCAGWEVMHTASHIVYEGILTRR
jgi:hypothetical protein